MDSQPAQQPTQAPTQAPAASKQNTSSDNKPHEKKERFTRAERSAFKEKKNQVTKPGKKGKKPQKGGPTHRLENATYEEFLEWKQFQKIAAAKARPGREPREAPAPKKKEISAEEQAKRDELKRLRNEKKKAKRAAKQAEKAQNAEQAENNTEQPQEGQAEQIETTEQTQEVQQVVEVEQVVQEQAEAPPAEEAIVDNDFDDIDFDDC